MARYVLAAFPSLPDWVEELRETFDPLAGLVPAHITLVHPFPSRLSPAELRTHIEASLEGAEPFEVTLQGVTGHEDEYLFLNVIRGKDRIVDLRQRLYRGQLAVHLNRSRTFLPHVTVGRFAQREQLDEALDRIGCYEQAVNTTVDGISGYRVHEDGRRESIIEVGL